MSARPEIPAEDAVNIEIDGQPCQARKGAMIIEVTDALGISVPRFCYHKKLSIAANCRMCMVEVEKVPKALPACATPVTEGMKIFTRSDLARGAQKGVMEFLLINHPLDCPICDQGGECELQDLALGYGGDVSRFAEKKRVVRDKYIGPLIATDMTRCIHCTRCIRMLREVAGKMELGATGRGENVEIGTYIEKSLESELSGNVIDVCPVGALTSKPFRFKARAWELQQHASIAPHDCIGSNLHVHTRRGQVMRVVPRENEELNEVWLSDRDRFSYEGLYSEERLEAAGYVRRRAVRGSGGADGNARGNEPAAGGCPRHRCAQHRSPPAPGRLQRPGQCAAVPDTGPAAGGAGVCGCRTGHRCQSPQGSADRRPPPAQGRHGRCAGDVCQPG
jgi:NADH-quinone oxidoreductase subunit G